MPIYIFTCEDCGNTYEINATIKEKEAGLKPKCPTCFSEHCRQLITAGFSFRSGGGGNMPFGGCGPNAGGGCCG